jgi:hypothetical protein
VDETLIPRVEYFINILDELLFAKNFKPVPDSYRKLDKNVTVQMKEQIQNLINVQ